MHRYTLSIIICYVSIVDCNEDYIWRFQLGLCENSHFIVIVSIMVCVFNNVIIIVKTLCEYMEFRDNDDNVLIFV